MLFVTLPYTVHFQFDFDSDSLMSFVAASHTNSVIITEIAYNTVQQGKVICPAENFQVSSYSDGTTITLHMCVYSYSINY